METISDIKGAFGVPQLVVEADPPTIADRTGGKVIFLEALKQGIQSFLEDGRNYDSPVGTILADPGAFDLPDVPVPDKINTSDLIRDWMHDSNSDLEYDVQIAPAATEMVRSWMNDPTSKMILCTPDYQYLPENGETVEDNWIFRLVLDRYTPSMHWAIIDRSGVKLPYNYGYG
ncbi:MAG: hypothetical protein AB4352_21695 [Hormoscilla sp.]